MTIRTVVERSDPRFVWLDVVDPPVDELAELAKDYELHPLSVSDCLDPEHLPKHEIFQSCWHGSSTPRSTPISGRWRPSKHDSTSSTPGLRGWG